MELRDFIVTPIILFAVYVVAYLIRPLATDAVTRRYFFPALTVRVIGALAVGFIYQFYYEGGDTFAYHTHGSRPLWEAIMESPANVRLLFANGEYGPGIWDTARRIWYWNDPQSFFVIRVAALLDLLTFSSYSATAILFATFAFAGAWMMFLTFYRLYPDVHNWIAISVLFVPTVVFWGSGIFKDTLTLAALGVATYAIHRLIFDRRRLIVSAALLIFSLWIIYSIKKYILLCFLPAILLWWVARRLSSLRPVMLRYLFAPVAVFLAILLAYLAVSKVGEDDPRYNVARLAETAKITAYDIRYGWGARTGEGSGYTLGELDGTWQSMIRLAPAAVNVALFRPYVWEVRSPLMALSAAESLALLGLTLLMLWKVRGNLFRYCTQPDVVFCFVFAVVFAFAVGVSTFNFGTLSRYKIPAMPFFLLGISIAYGYWKRDRKLDVLASTE